MKNCAVTLFGLILLLAATGCRNKPPLTPERPDGPDSVRLNTAAEYTSSTTDPNKDDIRYVFNWADGSHDTTDYHPSGEPITRSHTWTRIGNYRVQVRAQDLKEAWSEWSSSREVIVYRDTINNPPEPPSRPTGPDSAWVGDLLTFTSSAVDPDGDSVQIRFYWGDGSASAWSRWVSSGTLVNDTVRYRTRGVRDVFAMARDSEGDSSSWSPAARITVYGENTPPDKPVLTGPARGIKNGPMYLFYARARDNEMDSLEYKFFWDDGNESGWTASAPHNFPVPDSVRYNAEGGYSIRSIARDIDGLVSDTSDPLVFEVVGEGSILWSVGIEACIGSPAWSTVSVAGAANRPAIILGNLDGRLSAVDAWQGVILYDELASSEGFTSSPSVGESWSTIYIGNGTGQLYAFTNEGRGKWNRPWPDTASWLDLGTTAVVDGNNIYAGGETGFVFKVTDIGNDAEPVWLYEARDEVYASPVLSGNRLIVCDDSGYVHILNANTGSREHLFFADGGIVASPAVDADGNIYIGTKQGTMYGLSPTGTELWSYTITPFAQVYASPVIANDGGIVFAADDGYIYKFDPATGEPMPGWPLLITAANLTSTPAISADGVIYVLSDDDQLFALNEDGSLHWPEPLDLVADRGNRRMTTSVLTPSLLIDRYGTIYAVSVDFGLFAIAGRPTGTLANTPWPMFQHDIRHSGRTGSR